MDNKRIRQNSTRISVEENMRGFLGIMWITGIYRPYYAIKRMKNSPESEQKQTGSGETAIKAVVCDAILIGTKQPFTEIRLFYCERFTVCTFTACRVCFMGTDFDFVKCTVVFFVCVMTALFD